MEGKLTWLSCDSIAINHILFKRSKREECSMLLRFTVSCVSIAAVAKYTQISHMGDLVLTPSHWW